ncbi:MAG: serine hydrolase [Pseudonocardiaceae bacterium]
MRRIAVGIILLLVFLSAPALADEAEQHLPDTPVGRQVSWLIEASSRLPVGEAEAREHLAPGFLDAVGLEPFNATLGQAAGESGLRLVALRPAGDTVASGVVAGDGGEQHVRITVDDAGLIAALRLTPLPRSPAELDERLHRLAPQVSFLAAQVESESCRPVHSRAADTARPVGSAFKLYVLGALARAVERGEAAWDEQLAIREEWRSLGEGGLNQAPAGATYPLRRYAELMISISDNTATDHLIRRLDRRTVEDQRLRFGMADPAANVPFPLTRDVLQLKGNSYPAFAEPYRQLHGEDRRSYLDTVIAPLPLAGIQGWTAPRDIDTIEWFASPADLCRAFVGLHQQAGTAGLEPVAQALSINGGSTGLDPAQWPTVWFKGGSEAGVLTLNYLASTAQGRTFVVSVMVSDPAQNLDPATSDELVALVHSAFRMAADATG